MLTCFACNQPMEYPKQGTKNVIRLSPWNRLVETPLGLDRLYGMNIYCTSQTAKGESRVYFVKIYCEYNDFGGFTYLDDNIYDKVFYRWENDSLLKFRLFNSGNNRSKSFTYSCFKGNRSMGIDSINGVPIDSKPR